MLYFVLCISSLCGKSKAKKMNSFTSNFSAVVIGICLLFVLPSCENNIKEINEITKKKETLPGEIAKQLDIIYTDSGRVKMHMTAPIMKHFNINIKDTYEEFPEGVFIEFFNETGEVKSTLQSKYAIRYDGTKKMEAKNEVMVINEFGEKLNTNHLIWDENTRKIKTNGHVKVTTKKEILDGEGLNANEDFSEWEITKPSGHTSMENTDSTKKN